MRDLLSLSARSIDENLYEGVGIINRPSRELSEVGDGIAVIEAFSHVVSFDTGDGLVLFDTSLEAHAEGILKSLRAWSDAPVSEIVFTHGHVDHVGGAGTILAEAAASGSRRPRVIGHENVKPRFDRYELTNGYNWLINARQFAPAEELRAGVTGPRSDERRFGPKPFIAPDTTFRETLSVATGDITLEMNHAKGETDDHLWAWIPEKKAICSGDFVCWVFPNAGNPQKVQRYPLEWARALRDMAAMAPELLLPAHGLPVGGRERIHTMLTTIAGALEELVRRTLDAMNAGARLDQILAEVTLSDELLAKPYLRPVYDEPEFVVRNIWRLYGGWYDGNPARLKPAPDDVLAREVARLAGGAEALARRAGELAEAGDLRLACHLAEMAVQAEPENRAAHTARRDVYGARRRAEASLMSKGIYGAAERDSAKLAD